MTPPFLTPHTPLSKTSLTQPLRLKPLGNACHPKLIPRADSSKATPRRKAVSLPFRDGIHWSKDFKRQVLVLFFIQELKQSRSVTPAGWTCTSLLTYLSNWSLSSIKPLKKSKCLKSYRHYKILAWKEEDLREGLNVHSRCLVFAKRTGQAASVN